MRKLLLLLGLVAFVCTPTMAGKNAGGAMVVHTDDMLSCTYFVLPDYCAEFPYDGEDCTELNPTCGYVDPEGLSSTLVYYVAAFPPGSNPGVTVIFFGHDHNVPPGLISGYSLCGPENSLEVPDDGWPDDPNAGNSVAFGSPVAGDLLFPFYWLCVYGDAGNYIGTGINPTGGYAGFVSDDTPGVLDECLYFGQVRWFEPGFNDCPEPPPETQACCFEDGSCDDLLAAECDALGGVPWGPGTICDPNPCPPPYWACCFEDGTCLMMQEEDCLISGGYWIPEVDCDPNPCGPLHAVCCLLEANGLCVITYEEDCLEQCGSWMPELGDDCEPNPCPPILPPSGACCGPDGTCYIEFACTCEHLNGDSYVGDDVPCDPNPCPTAVDATTWGQIKSNYR